MYSVLVYYTYLCALVCLWYIYTLITFITVNLLHMCVEVSVSADVLPVPSVDQRGTRVGEAATKHSHKDDIMRSWWALVLVAILTLTRIAWKLLASEYIKCRFCFSLHKNGRSTNPYFSLVAFKWSPQLDGCIGSFSTEQSVNAASSKSQTRSTWNISFKLLEISIFHNRTMRYTKSECRKKPKVYLRCMFRRSYSVIEGIWW